MVQKASWGGRGACRLSLTPLCLEKDALGSQTDYRPTPCASRDQSIWMTRGIPCAYVPALICLLRTMEPLYALSAKCNPIPHEEETLPSTSWKV